MAKDAIVAGADVGVPRGGQAALDIFHEVLADVAKQVTNIGCYGNVHN
jgi:hypothetical protein